MPSLRLSPSDTLILIRQVSENCEVTPQIDVEKHILSVYINRVKCFDLRLPLPFPRLSSEESLLSYCERLSIPPKPYSIILIQAEYCALGFFDRGECLRHRALRTYVVRRKRGKSQLTFSQSGKKGSTSGSQLRYRNAVNFFEKIKETLNEWKTIEPSERILYSCSINLWNFLFNGKTKCGFSKNDPRLFKIPLDVRIPNYDELRRINKLISFGYISYDNAELMYSSFHLNSVSIQKEP